jgi:hypothetical protein
MLSRNEVEAKNLGRGVTIPQILRRIAPQNDIPEVWIDALSLDSLGIVTG